MPRTTVCTAVCVRAQYLSSNLAKDLGVGSLRRVASLYKKSFSPVTVTLEVVTLFIIV